MFASMHTYHDTYVEVRGKLQKSVLFYLHVGSRIKLRSSGLTVSKFTQ